MKNQTAGGIAGNLRQCQPLSQMTTRIFRQMPPPFDIVSGMASPEHVARLKEGVGRWNQWREKNPKTVPEFRGVYLSGADLRGANFGGIDLSLADLSKANLGEAKLTCAHLNGANLSNAKLCAADLRGADLTSTVLRVTDLRGADISDANLCMADLRGADLSRAKLIGGNLSGAILNGTVFNDVNLRFTTGLDSVCHFGPSHIGIDTVYRSGSGNDIPDSFLRGCGVPEPFIVQMKALIGAMEPIQFYSCFISYSSHDESFAARIHADLRAKNLRCWFAPEDLKIGDRFQERIEESIRVFDKVMIVLSNASVQSPWVEREVNAAREREDRENRTVLFPIRIDDAVMNAPQPWAADIRRSRHIGDFREWQTHGSYMTALDRLLRDLKTADIE